MSKIKVKKCGIMPPNLEKKDWKIKMLFEWEGELALKAKK
jgi:hypothetical protein